MRQNKKNRVRAIAAIAALASILVIVMIFTSFRADKGTVRTDPAAIKRNTPVTVKEDVETPIQDTQNQRAGGTSGTPITLPVKPVLSKSSGNNGPIPQGATVNFTCTGSAGDSCSIILAYNGKEIVLGPKDIKDNGRGQALADFYWTATQGVYQVIAQAKNASGQTNVSSSQALEVQ